MSDTLSGARESARFSAEQLFFSRTNRAGLIQSANSLFQFVSEFEWADIIGAPHKLVRHPGMPRAVFHMMWSRLAAGEPLGLYVVNQSKGGNAYTVFAVAMPLEDGYISVRLKPLSEQVPVIKALYDDIAREEAQENLEPEQSMQRLLSRINDLGFADYDAFMADSLERELLVRVAHLQKLRPHDVASLSAIQKAVETIAAAGQDLETLLKQTNQIPDNMRLQAMRLEGRDGPIGVISANYQSMTETFSDSLKDFVQAAKDAVAPVRSAKFLAATCEVIVEVARQLRTETGLREEKKDVDLRALERLASHYDDETAQAVEIVAQRAEYFKRVSKDMRRMVFGLEMTRTMCNIERSKSSSDTDALDGVVERLQSAETQLSDLMTGVEGAVHDITDRANNLLRGRKDRRKATRMAVALAAE